MLLCCLICSAAHILAQPRQERCGFRQGIQKSRTEHRRLSAPLGIPTADSSTEIIIPVVFHFILTAAQMEELGNETGIRALINKQMSVLNKDFQGQNADTTNIPASFRAKRGKTNISFRLAHTDPRGKPSEGYTLALTTQKGFELRGDSGTNFGFSTAKYKASGGQDPWDAGRYLNVWVINMLENNRNADYVGLTIAPFYSMGTLAEPEIGITLNYRLWKTQFVGRILTHEAGHYFSLLHIWGNDAGCTGGDSFDDEIEDTPPQADATYGNCPAYPQYDACSASGDGIMFMNYMDYTDEHCQNMFTRGQTTRMLSELSASGNCFGLTQHPELTEYPPMLADDSFSIYPNPSAGDFSLFFPGSASSFRGFELYSLSGRIVYQSTEVPGKRL